MRVYVVFVYGHYCTYTNKDTLAMCVYEQKQDLQKELGCPDTFDIFFEPLGNFHVRQVSYESTTFH